jgi:hypothetical protein
MTTSELLRNVMVPQCDNLHLVLRPFHCWLGFDATL